MKIYFDGTLYSWQSGGGIFRYFDEIIGRCGKENDIEPILLMPLPSFKILHKEGVTEKNILLLRTLPNFIFKLSRKILSPINNLFFEFFFKNVSNGVFHSTYYTTYKKLRIPQVLTVHDMTYEKFPLFFNSNGAKRFIANKKKCITKADSIICVSETTKKALQSLYKIDDKKISVIYHGLSENFISEPNKYNDTSLNEPYFLFVGNRRLYKNFDFLINSFSKWDNNKKFKILLIGGGKLTKEEITLIENCNLKTQVKHLGFIEEKYLKYIYQKSKAFIFPSLDEGFGIPIIEAICSKTQVIASNIDVFKEIGEDMIIYFDPRNVESLLNALDQSINNKIPSDHLEKKAKYVTEKYSWENCFIKTKQVYIKTNNNPLDEKQ